MLLKLQVESLEQHPASSVQIFYLTLVVVDNLVLAVVHGQVAFSMMASGFVAMMMLLLLALTVTVEISER